MNTTKKLTPYQREEAYSRIMKGESGVLIAKDVKCSPKQVYEIRRSIKLATVLERQKQLDTCSELAKASGTLHKQSDAVIACSHSFNTLIKKHSLEDKSYDTTSTSTPRVNEKNEMEDLPFTPAPSTYIPIVHRPQPLEKFTIKNENRSPSTPPNLESQHITTSPVNDVVSFIPKVMGMVRNFLTPPKPRPVSTSWYKNGDSYVMRVELSPPCSLQYSRYSVQDNLPLLVLLHGLTENRQSFYPLITLLKPYFEIISMDIRGHGESPITYGFQDYFPKHLAVDVHETLCRAVGRDAKPILVGHSLGAYVATEYAKAYPGQVRGVVNIDQPLNEPFDRAFFAKFESVSTDEEFVAFAREEMNALYGPLPEEEKERLRGISKPNRLITESAWGFGSPEIKEERIGKKISAVKCLVILGSTVRNEHVGVSDLFEDVTILRWKECGHYPHLMRKDDFVCTLRYHFLIM